VDTLRKYIRGTFRIDEIMAQHTSFRIGGPVDIFVEPADIEDLKATLGFFSERSLPFFLLGRGTNLLVRDGGIRGAVISTRKMMDIEKISDKMIFAEAGVPLAALVKRARGWSLSGLEFCAGIPGSVGGAVLMNAGAQGSDMGGVVAEVDVLEADGVVTRKKRGELHFEYRELHLGGRDVIVGAYFTLKPKDGKEIQKEIDGHLSWRKSRQPLGLPSAGSVFKNPEGSPAGRLIDEVGLKGAAIGGAQVSDVHANFIINQGNATAREVLELIELIRSEVREKRGIDLELEIIVLGEDAS
jgi:UDP-N-acetylmuramate dehydrogenase